MPEELESFLDLGVDLDEVPELKTVSAGEYELVLATFERRMKTGPFLYLQFEIAGEPAAKIVTHTIMLPTPKDEERQKDARLRAVKHFYKAFDIPTSGPVEFQNYIGNHGWGILSEEESEDYGIQNRVRRFIAK